ncbi:hypothetical protein NQ176_g2297 [Zarea fungicola]|uniref:Uncharacterized protein n=1 Tax=Zarea fungicola TaxID=93591 RepID=A0ACC1NP03_9HYPO|nr:hypothetical protein NQ176_g2297 [Lecanicillium fungicola]
MSMSLYRSVTLHPQHKVDLDILDAADVPAHGPGELGVGVPRLAHGEKGRMCDGLGVGRDAVVLEGSEVDNFGLEAAEDGLDLSERRIGRAVLDEHERLVGRVDTGPMERVARDDIDVRGEMLFKGRYFWRLARRLPADDGTHLCRYT